MTLRILTAAVTLGIGLAATSAEAQQSAFGCHGLAEDRDLPVVEGKDGVFFRVRADLRMNHPFSDAVVEQLGELSRALRSRGTTLVYAPVPTKSVAMPSYLPDAARLYGFDLAVATQVHDDIRDRLRAAGVEVADMLASLRDSDQEEALPFFRADFHWSAAGANLGAKAIAETLEAHPSYEALDKTQHASTPLTEEVAFSGMRRVLQAQCTETLPEPVTMTWETAATQLDLGLGGGGLDLFGDAASTLPVVLVGTSFSDSPINNFPGFIAEHSALEVVNYAITGGNQFGAITSYLTSEDFQSAPPTFLVWENPIYNNLSQFGDQPMRELITAAWNNCGPALAVEPSADGQGLSATLPDGLKTTDALFLDASGSSALDIVFAFQSEDGRVREKYIRRGERLRRTGRFYMPLTGLWPEGATDVVVTLSEKVGPDASIRICSSPENGEES